MTDTEITSKETKIKDPAKVARGKQLAAISKQAKEDKMRKRIQDEMPMPTSSKTGYVVGVLGLLSALGAVAYTKYNTSKSEPKSSLSTIEEEPSSDVETKSSSRLVNL